MEVAVVIVYPNAAHWERLFPGNSAAILLFLEPLYHKQVHLAHRADDLEELARKAFFWRKGFKVLTFVKRDFKSVRDRCKTKLNWEIYDRFPLSDLVDDKKFEDIFSCLSSFIYVNCNGLKVSVIWSPEGFVETMLLGVIVAGLEGQVAARKYRPLLELWLAGNFPIGFDEDNNLLVLVAD